MRLTEVTAAKRELFSVAQTIGGGGCLQRCPQGCSSGYSLNQITLKVMTRFVLVLKDQTEPVFLLTAPLLRVNISIFLLTSN